MLSVASEIFPLVKTGGLGDVTGALPPALRAAGAETITLVPGYPGVVSTLTGAEAVCELADLFGGPATVLRGTAAKLDLLVIDAPHLFQRPGNPYLGADGLEWPDNGVRFAGLGAVAGVLAVGLVPRLAFDIVHAHDWQAAMAAVYLRFHHGRRPPTVLTIHNLAFQGRYPATLFARLGLPDSAFGLDGLEYFGDVNFLKGGLASADRLTTVSPTYAQEILGTENGMGLDGVLRHRASVLSGILNGIDNTVWNPQTDALIPTRFSSGGASKRAGNKAVLQQRMSLNEDPDALLLGVISRLTSQKGLDLLLNQLDMILAEGMQLALLGSGDIYLEAAFAAAAGSNRGRVGCTLGYNEPLAHLIQAGSDAILVPSRFEPCGLTQLCALRYGSIPVVSRVGGLADSVIDANEAALSAGVATGIQFWPATSQALHVALGRLSALWGAQSVWERVQRNGMAADVSWRGSANRYLALYKSVLAERS